MQHYDIPTRLLDFSKNNLIALYFSLSKKNASMKNIDDEIEDFIDNNGYSVNGSSVYLIDPYYTNQQSINEEIIYDLGYSNFESLKKIDLPLCINTDFYDARLLAQEGVFVFFGSYYNSYEYYQILKNNIYKIFIPNSIRNEMFEELKLNYNTTHSTIFPDMKGIAIEIIDEIEKEYCKSCDRVFHS